MAKPESIPKFLIRYTPEIASQLKAARLHLAGHFPRGYELVYDNYNALVFGYGPTDRASDAIVSIAGYPQWVTLFFLHGATLRDPKKLLQGTGVQVRSIRLRPASVLLEPAVQALIKAAIAPSAKALAAAPPLETIVKSVSAKQKPRRPTQK